MWPRYVALRKYICIFIRIYVYKLIKSIQLPITTEVVRKWPWNFSTNSNAWQMRALHFSLQGSYSLSAQETVETLRMFLWFCCAHIEDLEQSANRRDLSVRRNVAACRQRHKPVWSGLWFSLLCLARGGRCLSISSSPICVICIENTTWDWILNQAWIHNCCLEWLQKYFTVMWLFNKKALYTKLTVPGDVCGEGVLLGTLFLASSLEMCDWTVE